MTWDWHAERYAAGEKLARAAQEARQVLTRDSLWANRAEAVVRRLDEALAEYERTKDAP